MLYNPKWEEKVTAPADDWRATLLSAAAIVRKRGLAQHIQETTDGRVCIHGAISIAACGRSFDDSPLECRASEAVCRYLNSTLGTDYQGGAAGWNNRPGRTADEVIAVLEAAARS